MAGKVCYKGNNIFSSENAIEGFARKVSEEYGEKNGEKLVERNRGLEYAVETAATSQYGVMQNLNYARDTIDRLINKKGKSEPKYYTRRAQESLNAAKFKAKESQKLLSGIPDAVKIQINPTGTKSFKKSVNAVQRDIDKQLNKYYGKNK